MQYVQYLLRIIEMCETNVANINDRSEHTDGSGWFCDWLPQSYTAFVMFALLRGYLLI